MNAKVFDEFFNLWLGQNLSSKLCNIQYLCFALNLVSTIVCQTIQNLALYMYSTPLDPKPSHISGTTLFPCSVPSNTSSYKFQLLPPALNSELCLLIQVGLPCFCWSPIPYVASEKIVLKQKDQVIMKLTSVFSFFQKGSPVLPIVPCQVIVTSRILFSFIVTYYVLVTLVQVTLTCLEAKV